MIKYTSEGDEIRLWNEEFRFHQDGTVDPELKGTEKTTMERMSVFFSIDPHASVVFPLLDQILEKQTTDDWYREQFPVPEGYEREKLILEHIESSTGYSRNHVLEIYAMCKGAENDEQSNILITPGTDPNALKIRRHIQSKENGFEMLNVRDFDNTGYTLGQMLAIIEGDRKGLKESHYYKNPDFDPAQMRIIQTAIEENRNVEALANPDFSPLKMNAILTGLRDGSGIPKYTDTTMSPEEIEDFNRDYTEHSREWREMHSKLLRYLYFSQTAYDFNKLKDGDQVERVISSDRPISWFSGKELYYSKEELDIITDALQHGIDLENGEFEEKLLEDPTYPINYKKDMLATLKARESIKESTGVSFEADELLNINPKQTEQVILAAKEGLTKEEINVFLLPETYTAEQMEVFRKALLKKVVDPSVLDHTTYEPASHEDYEEMGINPHGQQYIIAEAIVNGLDYERLLEADYDYRQMDAIFRGLYTGEDISVYASPRFSGDQMLFIWQAMTEGCDVSSYADPELSVAQMTQLKQIGVLNPDPNHIPKGKFTEKQLEQIKTGLFAGHDMSFVHPDMDADAIQLVMEDWKKGIDIVPYAEYIHRRTDATVLTLAAKEGYLTSIGEYLKNGYDSIKCKELLDGLVAGIAVEKYDNPSFDMNQMLEIKEGMMEGLNPDCYAYPEFTYLAIQQIKGAMREKLPIEDYLDKRLNWEQLSVIRRGLQEGFDERVKSYCNPAFSANQMDIILKAMKEGLVESYIANPKYDEAQMQAVYNGLHSNLPISLYSSPEFTAEKMNCILSALHSHISKEQLLPVSNPEFSLEQMEFLTNSLKRGMDISQFCDPSIPKDQMIAIASQKYDYKARLFKDFDSDQISQIVFGEEKGVEVSKYALPVFDADQMSVIRGGLEDGINASRYADPNLDYNQMSIIRTAMKQGYEPAPMLDKRFTPDQLRILLRTYKEGGDPSEFADPKLTTDQMNLAKTVQKFEVPGLMDFVKERNYEIYKDYRKPIEYSANAFKQSYEIMQHLDEPGWKVLSSLPIHNISFLKESVEQFHTTENTAFFKDDKVYWIQKDNEGKFNIKENTPEVFEPIYNEAISGKKSICTRFYDDHTKIESYQKKMDAVQAIVIEKIYKENVKRKADRKKESKSERKPLQQKGLK